MRIQLLALSFLMCVSLPAAAQTDADIRVVTGTVTGINTGCFVDGKCSFSVQTETGSSVFVWNQGDVMPSAACRIPDQVIVAATKLKVGQKVEVHAPKSSDILCGDKASIAILQ